MTSIYMNRKSGRFFVRTKQGLWYPISDLEGAQMMAAQLAKLAVYSGDVFENFADQREDLVLIDGPGEEDA